MTNCCFISKKNLWIYDFIDEDEEDEEKRYLINAWKWCRRSERSVRRGKKEGKALFRNNNWEYCQLCRPATFSCCSNVVEWMWDAFVEWMKFKWKYKHFWFNLHLKSASAKKCQWEVIKSFYSIFTPKIIDIDDF